MPTFYDSNGNAYLLTREIGRGGEGTVFFCSNDSNLVAKIYHDPVTEEKAEKLRWMAANKNDQLLKIAAWIVDTLSDQPDGKIVGFLMPNVKAKEIHELYSLKSRRIHFPEATWRFLIHTAANVARAFYVLHKNDHIMGDVNHGNLVVLADGRVNLIDCDSYSIKTNKRRYRCEVGVATHLAPELQGIDLSEVERQKNHDNFGLAVIIFQLLFLGRHPFAGNYLGTEDKSLEDCIRERRFAYGDNTEITNVKQPPGTLALAAISPRLAAMFERTFFTEDRPEPREWIEALEDLSDSLQPCPAHIGHHFFKELSACPWCELEAKTGLMLFPFVSSDKYSDENSFNIFTVENLLASFNTWQNLPAKPLKPVLLPSPSPEVIDLKRDYWKRGIGFAFLYLIISVILISSFGFADSLIWNLIALVGFLSNIYNFHKTNKKRLEHDLHDANRYWENLENEWKENIDDQKFQQEIQQIRQKVSGFQILQKERHDQLQKMGDKNFEYQLNTYLSSFEVGEVPGIEKKYQEALARYGLKTAADFDHARLNSLLAIDKKTKDILSEWREEIERGFEFDPNSELPETVKSQLERQFTESRRKVEKEIEKLLTSLRAGAVKIQQQQRQMLAKAENLSTDLLQAESNLTVLGNNAPITIGFIAIGLFVPIFNLFFQSVAPLPPKPRPRAASAANNSIVNAPVNISNSNPYFEGAQYTEGNYLVDEDVTDEQMARMSSEAREKSAKSLYSQALSLMNQKSYKAAEKKLQLAVRFVNYDTKILYSLATVYYEEKKHNESLKVLEQSLKINDKNLETKLLIGANYLRLKRYHEAELYFSVIKSDYPTSFEAYFNLGLTYKYLGNNNQAEFHFQQATQIKPNDVDAHYEYGVILFENGELTLAEKQYQNLLTLDAKRAEKLRKIIGTKSVK